MCGCSTIVSVILKATSWERSSPVYQTEHEGEGEGEDENEGENECKDGNVKKKYHESTH
jgi:hypothetical protein